MYFLRSFTSVSMIVLTSVAFAGGHTCFSLETTQNEIRGAMKINNPYSNPAVDGGSSAGSTPKTYEQVTAEMVELAINNKHCKAGTLIPLSIKPNSDYSGARPAINNSNSKVVLQSFCCYSLDGIENSFN